MLDTWRTRLKCQFADAIIACPSLLLFTFGPRREKTCLQGFANNTGADQPAHPCSLISAFAIGFLERTIFNLATGKISIF